MRHTRGITTPLDKPIVGQGSVTPDLSLYATIHLEVHFNSFQNLKFKVWFLWSIRTTGLCSTRFTGQATAPAQVGGVTIRPTSGALYRRRRVEEHQLHILIISLDTKLMFENPLIPPSLHKLMLEIKIYIFLY